VKSAEVGLVPARAALDRAHSVVAAASDAIDVAAADAIDVAAADAIDVAAADANHARAMLVYARIEAPFDGVVIRRDVDTGDRTGPGPDGPPLFVVARSDVVKVAVDAPEAVTTEVNPGDRASVRIQAMNGQIVEGKVSRISWALHPKTRTIRVEIDIPNPGGWLRPGLYAYATIDAEERPDVLTVPSAAIVEEDGKARCVVVANGQAARRLVVLGLKDGTRAEIASGLSGDESVIKANAASLADGQPVQVVDPAGR
jgi:RND family efflux transporter MFP subunit